MDPWVGKIPWRRAWQPTPGFLPGESPQPEEAGGLQSTGSPSVGSDLAIEPQREKETRPRGRSKGEPPPPPVQRSRARRLRDGESEGPRGRGRGSETLGLVPAAPGGGPGKAPAGGQHHGARLRTDPVHAEGAAAQVPACSGQGHLSHGVPPWCAGSQKAPDRRRASHLREASPLLEFASNSFSPGNPV